MIQGYSSERVYEDVQMKVGCSILFVLCKHSEPLLTTTSGRDLIMKQGRLYRSHGVFVDLSHQFHPRANDAVRVHVRILPFVTE